MIPTGASFAPNLYALLYLGLTLVLTACQGGDAYKVNLRAVSYDALPGWQEDSHAKAHALFVESCGVNARRGNSFTTKTKKSYASPEAWKAACDAARHLPNPTDEEAKNYFETHFTPYRATTDANTRGLTTGYYEPLLHGSKKPSARFHVPVYGVPYKPEHRNLTREKIEAGGLKGKAPILLYVDDPAMLFFLHIQGSGKVRMTDGSLVGLQYAAQNGHPFVPIGRSMKERGMITVMSMQSIRDWLLSHPKEAVAVMNENPSYIFFHLSPGDAYAKGALGISLTPRRSIAVDDERVPYGSPIYLSTRMSNPREFFPAKLRHLMVAQDTGGAIIGPIRYDIFFGRGARAEWRAGHQNTPARVYWLLPNSSGADAVIQQVIPSIPRLW
jgi:membrane-bound lytic murein transglycosylase A